MNRVPLTIERIVVEDGGALRRPPPAKPADPFDLAQGPLVRLQLVR
jgi:hypothetical protein